MFNKKEVKGHGSIRKSKVYGAVGILALGAAAIIGGGSQASADEVAESPVTTTPVTTTQASADSLHKRQLLQHQMFLLRPQRLQQTLLTHNLLKQ